MAEITLKPGSEGAEGAPRSEGEAKASPAATRESLVSSADGAVASLKGVLKVLEGSTLDAESQKLKADADAKREELKALLAKLLAEKKAAEGGADTAAPATGAEGAAGAALTEGGAEKPADARKEKESDFKAGDKVKWTNAKGVEMEGEVVKILDSGAVLVKTAKNKNGFAMDAEKLQKVEETPTEGAEEGKEGEAADYEKAIATASNWDELIAALGGVTELVGSDGTKYSRDSLIKGIEALRDIYARGEEVAVDSPIVKMITRTGWLRAQVIELVEKANSEKAEKAKKEKEEFEKPLRELLDEINNAAQAQNREAKLAALKKAAEVLGDESYTKAVLSRDKDGSELVDEALERAVKEAEKRLREGKKNKKEEEVIIDTFEPPPPGGGGEQPPGGGPDKPGGGEQPPGGGPDKPGGGEQPPGGGPDKPGGGEQPPEQGERGARLQELKTDYANKEAIARKSFGGIFGLARRLAQPGKYQEALKAREEALKAYQEERAEQVAGSVEKMIGEQISLAQEMATRMSEKKRIPGLSWIYDGYKKLGDIKLGDQGWRKHVSARMVISLGLLGAGFALGGAVAPIGFIVGRRMFGGAMAAFGKYDALTKGAEMFEPVVKLTPANQRELDQYKKDNKLGALRRGVNKFLFGGGDKDRKYKEKFLELAAKQANTMSDEDLEKAITYFEGNNVFFGKDPAQNESYMALMHEKGRRMQGLFDEVDADVNKEKGDVQKKYAEVVDAKKKELVQKKVNDVIDYLKEWHVVEAKLFEEMAKVQVPGATKEEKQAARRETNEYKEWEAGKARLKAMLAELPEDVQVEIRNSESSNPEQEPGKDQGRRRGIRELLDINTGEKISRRPEDIDAAAVAGEDWKLNAAFETKLRDLLDKNPQITEEAEAAVRREAGEMAQALDDFERRRERRKDVVIALLDSESRKHDDNVDNRIKVAVRRDAYRKLAAAALGIAIGTGAMAQLFRALSPFDHGHGGGAGGPGATEHPAGGGPGATEHPAGGGPGATEHPAGGGPGATEHPAGGGPGSTEHPADSGTEDLDHPKGGGPEQPDIVENSAEKELFADQYKQGNGDLNIFNRFQASHPDLFKGWTPKQLHDWRIGQLQQNGYGFANGKWGYPHTPLWDEKLHTSFGGIRFVEGAGGTPEMQLTQTDGAGHVLGTITKEGVLSNLDGKVVGQIDAKGVLHAIITKPDGSSELGEALDNIDGKPYHKAFKFHKALKWLSTLKEEVPEELPSEEQMQEAMSVNAGTIDSLAEQIRAAKLAALGVTAEQAENLNLEAAARLKEAVGPERFAEIMHDGDYVKSPFSPDGMPEPDEVFPSDDAAIPIDPMEQPSGAGPVLEGSMADKAEHLRMQGDYIRQQREYLEEISRAGEDTHLSAEQAAAHSETHLIKQAQLFLRWILRLPMLMHEQLQKELSLEWGLEPC